MKVPIAISIPGLFSRFSPQASLLCSLQPPPHSTFKETGTLDGNKVEICIGRLKGLERWDRNKVEFYKKVVT